MSRYSSGGGGVVAARLLASCDRLAWSRNHRSWRAVLGFVAAAAVVAVALADAATGLGVSLAVFYVLIIVGSTLFAGTAVGVLVTVMSAVAWAGADVVTRNEAVGFRVDVWNAVVRSVVLAVVVLLVAGLVNALRAARESEAVSRAFLASAAHQLRTPLTSVGAGVEALLVDGAPPHQERLLANIAAETSRLGRLVGALLRIARLDQGERPQYAVADPVELCRDELDRCRRLANLECELFVVGATSKAVRLDVQGTREALANLLDNARRHARSHVAVHVRTHEDVLRIDVADDGGGVPSGAEEAVFGRFVSLDGRGGSGLGLAIARDLARRQGGDLRYESGTFVLSVPTTSRARWQGRASDVGGRFDPSPVATDKGLTLGRRPRRSEGA